MVHFVVDARGRKRLTIPSPALPTPDPAPEHWADRRPRGTKSDESLMLPLLGALEELAGENAYRLIASATRSATRWLSSGGTAFPIWA
jgi:hypothetical protein